MRSYPHTLVDFIRADGATHYWPMSEAAGATTMTDVIGGNTLNLTGCTTGTAGRSGPNALSLNGTSSDHAQTASSLNLSGSDKWTFECLIKPGTYIGGYGFLWELSTNTNSFFDGLFFAIDGGVTGSESLMCAAHQGDIGYSIGTYTRMSAGSYHLLAGTYDKSQSSAEVNVILDGSLLTPSARLLDLNNTNAFGNYTFYVGARAGTSNYGVDKIIQHLAIYPSVLTPTRLLQHTKAALLGY